MTTSLKPQLNHIPCPCKVGDAKRFSFQDLRHVFTKLSEGNGTSMNVKCLAVSGCCSGRSHPSGIKWLVDLQSVERPEDVTGDFENAVHDLMIILDGEIIGNGPNFIRTAVPVNLKPWRHLKTPLSP